MMPWFCGTKASMHGKLDVHKDVNDLIEDSYLYMYMYLYFAGSHLILTTANVETRERCRACVVVKK